MVKIYNPDPSGSGCTKRSFVNDDSSESACTRRSLVNKDELQNFIEGWTRQTLIPSLKKRELARLIFCGPLGAGKTQTIQYLANSLGIKESLASPTFVLWQTYGFLIKDAAYTLDHLDLYRLENSTEISSLLTPSILCEPYHCFCIEWGEKIETSLPKPYFRFNLELVSGRPEERSLTLIEIS